MSNLEIRRQVESHSCQIDGVTYTFHVHSAAVLPGSHARLEIGGYRHNAAGATLIATMRVTAALPELGRVPALLTKALGEWLVATIHAPKRVH